MAMLTALSVKDFAALLASDAPAPGGGAASALAGALGVSLTNMVGSLTQGREKYAEHAGFVASLIENALAVRDAFLALVDEDAEVFKKIGAAYKLPKGSDGEKAARKEAIQQALKHSAATPYKMMELSLSALELTGEAIDKTNTNVASDLGVAALCLKAAVQGAWLNVAINLASIDDAGFTAEYREKCGRILDKALPLADSIAERITAAII